MYITFCRRFYRRNLLKTVPHESNKRRLCHPTSHMQDSFEGSVSHQYIVDEHTRYRLGLLIEGNNVFSVKSRTLVSKDRNIVNTHSHSKRLRSANWRSILIFGTVITVIHIHTLVLAQRR